MIQVREDATSVRAQLAQTLAPEKLPDFAKDYPNQVLEERDALLVKNDTLHSRMDSLGKEHDQLLLASLRESTDEHPGLAFAEEEQSLLKQG